MLFPNKKIEGNKVNRKNLAQYVALLLVLVGAPAFAQSDCGVIPEKPAIIDGATATMEELVANSEEVKSYIGGVDTFLDCYETFMQSDSFANLPEDEQSVYANAMETILQARNAIGPEFNNEVQAFRDAQPAE